MPPRIHLGINTCFAVKRWPEPDRWIGLIKDDLGLDCCQFSLDLVDPLQDGEAGMACADRIRGLADRRDLTIHSTCTGLAAYSRSLLLHPEAPMRAAAQQWYKAAIDFTARLGAGGTGGHIGAFSVTDAHDGTRRRRLIQEMYERLGMLARHAAGCGLRFLFFENMAVPREWGHTIAEAQELAEISADGGVPLLLCLDIGHPCALNTGTPSDDHLYWLQQPWKHAPILHLQQTDHTGDHHWPFTPEHNGVGMIRPERVLDCIEAWPFSDDVYLFLEPIHPFEADDGCVVQELKQSVRCWQEAIRGKGRAAQK